MYYFWVLFSYMPFSSHPFCTSSTQLLQLCSSFLQVGNTGFSIAAAKKANVSSLVIGPGAGYNLVSYLPLIETTTFCLS